MPALTPALTWISVSNLLGVAEADAKRRIPADSIGHPLDEGMTQLNTASDGSYIDYGRQIAERTWLVARQYADAYDVQILRLQPQTVALVKQDEPTWALARQSRGSIADLPTEAPGISIALGTALGAAVGALAGGGKGTAMGALIGSGAALAAVAVSNAETSPATSQAAQAMFQGLTTAALGGSTARRPALPPPSPRPASSRPALSRAERFDSADFEARRRKPTAKK